MLQDDCRGLSKWLSTRLGALQHIKGHITMTTPTVQALHDAEEALWDAQLERHPDSVRVSRANAVQWINEEPAGKADCRFSTRLLSCAEADEIWERRRDQVQGEALQCLALTAQFEAGVFFECCRRPGGIYATRGFRFGAGAHDFISGFGKD